MGFTMIELLVVIAILGVLAIVILVAINPVEKQAQSRDTGRISSVAQLGRSLEAYFTSRGVYPDEASWAQDLIGSGEFSTFPSGIDYTAYSVSECSTYVQPGVDPTYCYDLDTAGGNGAIVFARLEANSHNDKCSSPDVAYFAYSTADGRGGTICSSSDPTAWPSSSQIYVD